MQEIRQGNIPPLFIKSIDSDLGVVTQNTWYTALEANNISVILAAVKVTVADETVECRVTIDGSVIACAAGVALAAAGNHSTEISTIRVITGALYASLVAANLGPTNNFYFPLWCKGRNVKIEWRKTTAGGASHLLASTIYGRY